MSTGLLIRDFFKSYRELRFTDSGSIRFSEIEHNAYRMALTIEITHLDAPRYENNKTLPNNTHYGYVSLFKGSTVIDSFAIKYPKFRVFDIINSEIWNYHQATESMQLLAGSLQQMVNEQSTFFVATPGFIVGDTCRTLRFLFPPGADPVADLVLAVTGCGDPPSGAGERELSTQYRGFPVASPFPDVVKFLSDVPVSFLWRLELFYLVNPAVYIVDNPTDTGDETEGEEEFPAPDGESPFPPSSPADPESDPRDYTGGEPGEPPFQGGQCEGVLYRVNVARSAAISPPPGVTPYDVLGPVRGIRQESSVLGGSPFRTYFLRHGEPELETPLGGLFVSITSGSPPVVLDNNPSMTIQSVTRLDGLPDNCGNPLPISN